MKETSLPLLCVLFVTGVLQVEAQVCPPLPLGANMATNFDITSVNASSEPITVSCQDGYTLASGETIQHIKCESVDPGTAQWNSTLSPCSPVSCTDIPEVTQAHVIYSSTTYGSLMFVVCTSGYLREAAPRNISLVCNATGQWQQQNSNSTLNCNAILQNYLGCRQASSDLNVTLPNVSGLGTCISYCKSQNIAFSAVKGGDCHCETNLTSFGSSVNNFDCSIQCEFDPDGYCGGPDKKFSVFSVFDGCFSITDPSVFETSMMTGGKWTTGCLEYCRGNDYLVAMATRNKRCQCTNTISNITAAALQIQMCETSLSDLTDLGYSVDTATTVRVWTIDLLLNPRTGDNCNQLYQKGVVLHGNYYTTDTTKEFCQFIDNTACDLYWIGYKGSCYFFSHFTRNYNDSVEYCLDNDAHLVSVLSEAEEDFLEEAINTANSANGIWHLGLYDSQESASFQWNDGSMLVYTDFPSNEPSRPFEARCAAVIHKGDQINWYDQMCVEEENLICKKQTSLYYGCIEVASGDINVTLTHPRMTIGMCSQKCISLDRSYSAVNGQICYCFETLPGHVNLSWTSCDIRCPGHSYQPCGGENPSGSKSTIFVTGGSSSPILAESCEDLELQGLTEDTFLTTAGMVTCSTENAVTCPFSWINVDGHCYKFIVGNSNTPSTTCAAQGAYLAAFTDWQELDKIRNIINKVITLRNRDFWLNGLTDINKNKVVRWSNGQYLNHSANNLLYPFENVRKCHSFQRDSNNSDIINAKCHTNPFVCEKGNDYVGCFETPTYEAMLSGYIDMTISVCVELCRGEGRSYSLINLTSCWCNDSVDTSSSMSFSACTDFCLLGFTQSCGGPGHVSAYHIASYPEYAQSCDDLFHQGIVVPGTYKIAGESKYCTMSDNTTCPTSGNGSWIGVGQTGYCLMVSLDKQSDADAMAACRSRGGVLASARGATEWDFLKQVIKYSVTLPGTGSSNDILLGARDEFQSGLYSWADGSIMTFGLTELMADFVDNPGYKTMGTMGSLKLQTKATTDDWNYLCSVEKEYEGCYESSNLLHPIVSNYSTMSLTLCRQLCLGQHQTVALLHITKCICTTLSILGTLQRVTSDSDCKVSCQGHSGQNCATGSKLRAYVIEAGGLAESCSDLYTSGVLYKGDYILYNATTDSTYSQQCGFDIHDFSCPSGWMAHNRTCLQIFPLHKSQKQASEFCFQKGGYLFTPKFPDTIQYLFNIIRAVPQWADYSKWRTGAKEVTLEGYMVSADGMYLMSQDLKDDTFLDDVCIIVDGSAPRRYNCDDNLPFICEMHQAMVGCHTTNTSPTLSMSSANQMSVSQCMETCRGQPENSYFGIKNTTCHCYDEFNAVSSGVCTTACLPQPNQNCGGVSDFSVYRIAHYSDHVLSSCTELFTYGVTLEGWYIIKAGSQSLNVQCFSYGKGYGRLLGEGTGSVLSSGDSPEHPANSARLSSGELWPSSWKPDSSESWLELVLPDLYLIKAVFIQGGQSLTEQAWVESYTVKYSIQSGDWITYSTLTGNADRSSLKTYFLANPFLCDRIRLTPVTSHNAAAMRVELLGELYSSFNHTDRYVGCFVDISPIQFVTMGAVSSFSECLTACTKTTGYPFLALADDARGTTECKCGFSVGQYGQVSETMCDYGCDFSDAGCGRAVDNTLAVYRTYEKHCQDLESPYNSTRTVTKVYSVPDVMTFLTQITYTCITGYEFPDASTNMSITCLQSNEWNEAVPSCQVKHCPSPSDAEHASRNGSDTVYGTVISYTCSPGYVTSTGDTVQIIQCQDSKTWNRQPENCTPRPCDAPPTVENSIVQEDTSNLVYGDTLTYMCDPSSSFSDNSTTKTTTCDAQGQWSSIPSLCQFYQCPPAPFVPGAVSEYLGDFLLRYTCETDYEFEDGTSEVNSTCGSDNTWSPITKQCVFSGCIQLCRQEAVYCRVKGLRGLSELRCNEAPQYPAIEQNKDMFEVMASARRRESQICQKHSDQRIMGKLEVTSAPSSLSCGVLCLQNPACRYYNYYDAVSIIIDNCQLFVDTTANFNFVVDSGWDTYILRDSC